MFSPTAPSGSAVNNVAAGNWQGDLVVKLLLRDRREKAFKDFVESYNSLVQKLGKFADRNAELELSEKSATEKSANLSREIEILKEQGSPINQKRTAELEQQIQSLKEERAELYKTQGTNAQRLLDVNDMLRNHEETAKKNKEEIQRLSEANQTLTNKVDLQAQVLREKDVTIQLLQDEVATLQLELGKIDERMKDLEKENGQLLQRWLKKMNEEAERMNEANLFYESALEVHAKALEFQSGVVIVDKEFTPKPVTFTESGIGSTRTRSRSSAGPVIIPLAVAKKLTPHDGEIHTIQSSADGSMFATGSADKTIKIFDATTGQTKQSLSGSIQSIMHVSFNSTNDMIAGASNDNAARLWHLKTGRIRLTLTGHVGKVYSSRFNGDSSKVITGSHDRTIKVWDLQKGYCIRTIFSFSSCNDVVPLDEEGTTLVSGHLDNNLRFWDVRSGKDIKELTGIHLGQITSVSVSPDGSKVLTNSRDNTLKIVDLRTYDVEQTLHADGYKTGANWSKSCFSPDGRYVAAGSLDGTIFYWNIQKSKLEKTAKEHNALVCGVSWSPQGGQVFSADKDRTVCIWAGGLR
ncbi:30093_t:CDS:10 [Gigaspora margarita]|uniref:30093_t:CDS:1 n=2 Tax=Gigaspora margarita TaxID=4874 RepID=A0ABN7V7B1_GIGMA|nr:WD40 repeat-like protein [Gigaspora margarita]CAG8739756.1 30093_t:CDS:10 [Gigaspora margarita]